MSASFTNGITRPRSRSNSVVIPTHWPQIPLSDEDDKDEKVEIPRMEHKTQHVIEGPHPNLFHLLVESWITKTLNKFDATN